MPGLLLIDGYTLYMGVSDLCVVDGGGVCFYSAYMTHTYILIPHLHLCPLHPSLYIQKDKYENEDLIRFGLTEDVWFHVDDLSSAHVYLRQKPGEKLDDISPQLLLECASLVKVSVM